MRNLKFLLCPLCVGIMSLSMFSCSDDDSVSTGSVDLNGGQLAVDSVKTLFNGEVALLQQDNDRVMNYLNKRFVKTSAELSDNADVVVLDETKARELIAGGKEYDILKNIWSSNKILVFISPGSHAYQLVSQLNQALSGSDSIVTAPSDEALAAFNDVSIYAVRADGTALYHEAAGTIADAWHNDSRKTIEGQDSLYSPAAGDSSQVSDVAPVLSEYDKGRIAENLASWLNEHALTGKQHHVALQSESSSFSVDPVCITRYYSVTVTHDWFKKYSNSNASVPDSKTVDVKFHMDIYGAYSTTNKCDVYDVNMYEEFPAQNTFVKDKYVYEKAAYNYKYTGGCYYGPRIDLYLPNITESDIEVEEVAPLPQTDGQYNKTHYPMQLGFGASLQGEISETPGISAGLSMSCQLPYTTVSFNHSEMPISFSNDSKHATWEYSTDYSIYKCNWGFNPKYQDLPDVVHSFCKTDQAVTFVVKNTKDYGSKTMKLNTNVRWKVYAEYADPWEHWNHRQWWDRSFSTTLPKVYRYFGKYTPYPMPGHSGTGDGSEWGNLEERLMRNINYRALCDETLKVGAQVESGLDKTAESIWRSAIESLVTQYNGTTTTHEYVIALARENGSHIKLGLHIKDGVWRLVENVDNI